MPFFDDRRMPDLRSSPPPPAPAHCSLAVAVDDSSDHAVRRAERDCAAEPRGRRVALLVCHGMGQQVPFETIDAVATELAFVAARDGAAGDGAAGAATGRRARARPRRPLRRR